MLGCEFCCHDSVVSFHAIDNAQPQDQPVIDPTRTSLQHQPQHQSQPVPQAQDQVVVDSLCQSGFLKQLAGILSP